MNDRGVIEEDNESEKMVKVQFVEGFEYNGKISDLQNLTSKNFKSKNDDIWIKNDQYKGIEIEPIKKCDFKIYSIKYSKYECHEIPSHYILLEGVYQENNIIGSDSAFSLKNHGFKILDGTAFRMVDDIIYPIEIKNVTFQLNTSIPLSLPLHRFYIKNVDFEKKFIKNQETKKESLNKRRSENNALRTMKRLDNERYNKIMRSSEPLSHSIEVNEKTFRFKISKFGENEELRVLMASQVNCILKYFEIRHVFSLKMNNKGEILNIKFKYRWELLFSKLMSKSEIENEDYSQLCVSFR